MSKPDKLQEISARSILANQGPLAEADAFKHGKLVLDMVAQPQTSAAGVLALLAEPEPLLKQHAIIKLNGLVPDFWAEISEDISTM
jgi:hypothetical protein